MKNHHRVSEMERFIHNESDLFLLRVQYLTEAHVFYKLTGVLVHIYIFTLIHQ